jgi:hypothetical protein
LEWKWKRNGNVMEMEWKHDVNIMETEWKWNGIGMGI